MNCQAVHVFSLHMFGKQLQHGGFFSELGHLLDHLIPDAYKSRQWQKYF